ncbi:hypothetical protein FY557_17360 [Chryseobacterium sp. SN22]|uniref:hypothetical protein n=1 Tax=Chryseobacterium sp. SN22 TaxID=2606431 RepID=UPI0011EEDB4A|nr:hypothetical protein [Chryseobacterium sp. SN22]KAA0126419.1 hypothetical protein FY557_17360 [Chryseobacterium sp. SN22]
MELLIKFPDQSQSFTSGVEYGRLYDRMQRGEDYVTNNGFPVRIENMQLLKDTADKLGYISRFGAEYFGEWIEFSASKIQHSKN